MPSECNCLFVYGTLRSEGNHPLGAELRAGAKCLGRGHTPGRLYDFGEYPGLLAPVTTGDWVTGEIYELSDPDAILARLDHYEGCGPNDPEPHLFVRRLSYALGTRGDPMNVWVYLYNGDPGSAARIASGDYSERLRI